MTKCEKICKKEGHHCWDIEGVDVVDDDFDNVEMEMMCDRCGARAYPMGMFEDAPQNWKPLNAAYWKRREKERKEDEKLMMREEEKWKKNK